MSGINRYVCSNEKCDLEVDLAYGLPVWKAGTPERAQRLPVREHNKHYLIEMLSARLCNKCGHVVETEDATYVCPVCAGMHSFLEQEDTCPACHKGVVTIDLKRGVWF